MTRVLQSKRSHRAVSLKLSVPPGRRRSAAGACVVAVVASAAASADLFNGDGDRSNAWASLIGHAGGLLMVAFVALLCLKCLKELRAPGPADEIRLAVPAGKFTTVEKCVVYFGALALQFFVLYFAFLTTGRGFSVPEFWHALLSRFTSTDAIHYLYLAEHGYRSSGAKANLVVFYPLYPSLIWLFKLILGSYVAAGLFVSWACWGGACVSMLELAAQRYDRPRSALAALLLALYPFSFFSMGVFTESVFLLLSAQCLLRIEKRQWLAVGVLGCLAALCRTQGILLIFPAVYMWLLARKNKERDLKSLYLLLIPAGLGGYLLLNKIVADHWTAYVAYQKAAPWYQSARWISANLTQHYEMAQQYPGLAIFIYAAQLVFYFIAMGCCSTGCYPPHPHTSSCMAGPILACAIFPAGSSAGRATCSVACRCSCSWRGLGAGCGRP